MNPAPQKCSTKGCAGIVWTDCLPDFCDECKAKQRERHDYTPHILQVKHEYEQWIPNRYYIVEDADGERFVKKESPK